MDRRKSILNITVAVGFKILTMVMTIAVKRCLIQTCGNEANGLSALYGSILNFLAVAELGVGSAISFCMYRPIVAGDIKTVSGLYRLFHRWYLAVGAWILACGLVLIPFLPHFVRDAASLELELTAPFVLMLISTVLTYLFGAKTALINAYKNNYLTTAISSGGILLQSVLQIAVLKATGSFSASILSRIVAVLAQWAVTEAVSRACHGAVLSAPGKLEPQLRREVGKNVRAMFLHKIGYLLVNAVDGLVISGCIGVAALGRYANYSTLLDSMAGLLMLAFTSLTSVLGHLYAEKSRMAAMDCAEKLHLVNFLLGVVFFLGYYAVADDLVAILFSGNLLLEKQVRMVLSANGFVHFLRRSTLVFRDSTGTFYHDRWKPLAEGAANLALSLLLVDKVGVAGVILATLVTNLLICHIAEPYVLYVHGFGASPKGHYLRNYAMIAVFFAALLVLDRCMVCVADPWRELLHNGCISVGISAGVCAAAVLLWRTWHRNRQTAKGGMENG